MSEETSTYEGPTTPEHSAARPFGEIPSLWLKVTQMTEGFFAQEAGRASGSNTLISVLIWAAISTFLSIISSLVSGGIQTLLPREAGQMGGGFMGQCLICSLCGGLAGPLVGFYLSNGVIYLGARVFGGTGDFNTQSYLQSLFVVPAGIVMSLLSLVFAVPYAGPCLGGIAVLAVIVYAIILSVRAVKVAHDLTTGRAVAAIFVPALVIGLIVGCLAVLTVVVLALMGPAIGNIFENIVASI